METPPGQFQEPVAVASGTLTLKSHLLPPSGSCLSLVNRGHCDQMVGRVHGEEGRYCPRGVYASREHGLTCMLLSSAHCGLELIPIKSKKRNVEGMVFENTYT